MKYTESNDLLIHCENPSAFGKYKQNVSTKDLMT